MFEAVCYAALGDGQSLRDVDPDAFLVAAAMVARTHIARSGEDAQQVYDLALSLLK